MVAQNESLLKPLSSLRPLTLPPALPLNLPPALPTTLPPASPTIEATFCSLDPSLISSENVTSVEG